MNIVLSEWEWEQKISKVLAKRMEEMVKRYGADRIEKALETIKIEASERGIDLTKKLKYQIPEEVPGGPIA